MSGNREKAQCFLHKNKLIYDNIDMDSEVSRFIDQMELGLSSSRGLPMVPTYVEGKLYPKQGKKAIAVDVGGTNLRVALLALQGETTQIISLVKERVLGKDKPVSFDVFLDDLAGKIEPLLGHSRTICFSFAHEIIHNNKMDGTVAYMSKEVCITGIEKKPLALSLKNAVKKRTGCDVNVFLINDTVGVAGSMLQLGDKFQNYFGVVMGTGTNACYIEKCEHIEKIDDAATKTMFINVEAGSYVPGIVSMIDREFDATTAMPGTAILEKMTSGEYIGKLFFFLLEKACADGLFSQPFANAVKKQPAWGTKELSVFYEDTAKGPYGEICENQNDRDLLSFFADCLIKRAASLISIMIIAISKKIYEPTDAPICVIVEGATFYGLKGFKDSVESTIARYAKDMNIELYNVRDAALVGIGNIGLALV